MWVLKLVGAVLLNCLACATVGMVLGVWIGAIEGALLGALLCAIGIVMAALDGATSASFMSIIAFLPVAVFFGFLLGAVVGGLCGAVTFAVLGVTCALAGRDSIEERGRVFENALHGAWRGGMLCALAGASSALPFYLLAEMQYAVWSSYAPPILLYGPVIGFATGFFTGALFGGLSRNENWLNAPWRTLRAQLRAKLHSYFGRGQ